MSTRFASPPTTRASRATAQSTITKVFQVIGLNDQEINYLQAKGMRSPVAVLTAYENDAIARLESADFPFGACMLLDRLGSYIKYLQEIDGNLNALARLDADMFDTFDPKKVHVAPQARAVSPVRSQTILTFQEKVMNGQSFKKSSLLWLNYKDWVTYWWKIPSTRNYSTLTQSIPRNAKFYFLF